MLPRIPFKAFGFSLDELTVSSLALTSGTQGAAFSSAVATQIGSNAIVQVKVAGVVKYRATVSGSLSSSGAGVVLPATLNAPTINIADALTDPNCFLEVVNATVPTTYLSIPIVKGSYNGLSGKFAITEELDGTSTLSFYGVLLAPPSVLDQTAGSTTTPSAGVDATPAMILSDMANDNDALALAMNGSALATRKSQTFCPSYDALVDMCMNNRGTLPTGVDSIVPHIHLWDAAANSATNTKVQIRRLEVLVLRKSTGTWLRLGGPTRPWGMVLAGTGAGTSGSLAYEDDGEVVSVVPLGQGYEITPLFPYEFSNKVLIADTKRVHVRAQLRLGKTVATTADDRTVGRYFASVGFEFHDSETTLTARPPTSFPVKAMMGGNGRSKLVPYTAPERAAGNWMMFSYTAVPSFTEVGTPLPWGNGTPAWAYDAPPWVPTTAEFNTTPPWLP